MRIIKERAKHVHIDFEYDELPSAVKKLSNPQIKEGFVSSDEIFKYFFPDVDMKSNLGIRQILWYSLFRKDKGYKNRKRLGSAL